MELHSPRDQVVWMIWDKKRREYVGSYSRAYHDEYMFPSREEARNANCHGMFHDGEIFEFHKFMVEFFPVS